MGQIMSQERITVANCHAHPDRIYVFGDNLRCTGKAGQAERRLVNL
jgi:hypothetical protein